MSDRVEEIASHIILMSARGDIAPISAGDALSIAEAVSPCRNEVVAVFRELVAAIDAKDGWYVRATLESALSAIQTPKSLPVLLNGKVVSPSPQSKTEGNSNA